MPRQPRYFLPDMPQHVIQRGNDRQATFYESCDYRVYKHALYETAQKHHCDIHAYVLMTNHVHLLVSPRAEKSIPKLMQCLGRRYVTYINKTYGRTGTLWEGRYKASPVDSDDYLLRCHQYIELNPVRAGIVSDPADYAESSYRCNGLAQYDHLVTPHECYRDLGATVLSRCKKYRQFFADDLEQGMVTDIRNATNSCLVIGSEEFKDRIEDVLNRTVRHGRSGRPTKTAV